MPCSLDFDNVTGPHRIREMRTIAIDDPDVCQSVSLSVTRTDCSYAKTAERIDVPLEAKTLGIRWGST